MPDTRPFTLWPAVRRPTHGPHMRPPQIPPANLARPKPKGGAKARPPPGQQPKAAQQQQAPQGPKAPQQPKAAQQQQAPQQQAPQGPKAPQQPKAPGQPQQPAVLGQQQPAVQGPQQPAVQGQQQPAVQGQEDIPPPSVPKLPAGEPAAGPGVVLASRPKQPVQVPPAGVPKTPGPRAGIAQWNHLLRLIEERCFEETDGEVVFELAQLSEPRQLERLSEKCRAIVQNIMLRDPMFYPFTPMAAIQPAPSQPAASSGSASNSSGGPTGVFI